MTMKKSDWKRSGWTITELGWDAIALFLQSKKHLLDPKHHAFIDDMADMASCQGRGRTDKQHEYLAHLGALFLGIEGNISLQ
jgi:hypothetical protein